MKNQEAFSTEARTQFLIKNACIQLYKHGEVESLSGPAS